MTGPLSFSISAEQEALVDVARSFGERQLAPYYKQREQEGAFDRATLRAMGRLGLFGVELPEQYGGLGLDCTTAGLVLEAVCRSDYNVGQLMVTMSLSGAIMARHGDPAVVAPWLRGVTAGEMIPAIALTEPGGGSDAANLTLRATKDGARYILDGEKTSTSFDPGDVRDRLGPHGCAVQRCARNQCLPCSPRPAGHQNQRVRRSRRSVRRARLDPL